MSLSSVQDIFYRERKLHDIFPQYYIDFTTDTYKATCNFNGVELESTLKPYEIKHIDTDYLYFEVGILLTTRLNKQIENLNALNTPIK